MSHRHSHPSHYSRPSSGHSSRPGHVSSAGHASPPRGGIIAPSPKPATGQPSKAQQKQPATASSVNARTGGRPASAGGGIHGSQKILGDTKPAGAKEEKIYVETRDRLLAKGHSAGIASQKAEKAAGYKPDGGKK
jgi:hypothetical protein